jgi:hypothetical protein
MFERNRSAEMVAGSFSNADNDRLREILVSLVEHLHAFAKDVELRQGEFEAGINFLTRTGQKCDDTRQEFVLLSDVLGLSMLVDSIENDRDEKATDSTVLGPFHMCNRPSANSATPLPSPMAESRRW